MQLCQTLRELGFSILRRDAGSGLTPLDAIMSGPTGAWNAEMFGWKAPFPDEPHRTRRQEIEVHANEIHAQDFEVLSTGEREIRSALQAGAEPCDGSAYRPFNCNDAR